MKINLSLENDPVLKVLERNLKVKFRPLNTPTLSAQLGADFNYPEVVRLLHRALGDLTSVKQGPSSTRLSIGNYVVIVTNKGLVTYTPGYTSTSASKEVLTTRVARTQERIAALKARSKSYHARISKIEQDLEVLTGKLQLYKAQAKKAH